MEKKMLRIAKTLAAVFALVQPAAAQTFLPGPSPTIWVESVSPSNLGCKAQGRFRIRTANWDFTMARTVVITSASTGTGDNVGRVHFKVKPDTLNQYTPTCDGCGYFYFQPAC